MRSIIPGFFLLFALFSKFALSVHFYVNSGETKCFYENLSKGNLLIADLDTSIEKKGIYEEDSDVVVMVTIDETFDNNHRVLSQKNAYTGDFTFTALDSGEHKICGSPSYPQELSAKIRVFIELDIGHVSSLDSQRKDDVKSTVNRMKQLNQRLLNIRQEQREIRENEAIFRDQSESVNSKIMSWSILQFLALIAVCWFQLRYLKNFFIKQKVL